METDFTDTSHLNNIKLVEGIFSSNNIVSQKYELYLQLIFNFRIKLFTLKTAKVEDSPTNLLYLVYKKQQFSTQ